MGAQDIFFQQTGLSEQEIEAICRVFAKHSAVERVVLHGSRAKGSHRPASDIDLIITGRSLSGRDLLDIEMALDDLLLPYKIDIDFYHQIDNPALIEHIERVGKILFSRKKPSLL